MLAKNARSGKEKRKKRRRQDARKRRRRGEKFGRRNVAREEERGETRSVRGYVYTRLYVTTLRQTRHSPDPYE